MRRIEKKIQVLLAVFLVVFFTLHAEALSAEDEGETGIEVTEVSGKSIMLLEGEEEWQHLQGDTFLLPGDKVKTEADSSAEFAFDEDGENAVRLEALTEVEVILEKDEKISLITGEVFSIIDNLPEGSAFEIRTPTAVCGARGTDWVTKFDGSETQVESVTGDTYVTGFNPDGSRMKARTIVRSGNRTAVKRFKPPVKPVKLRAKRRSELTALKADVSHRARNVISKRRALPGAYRRSDRMKQKRFMAPAGIGGMPGKKPGSSGYGKPGKGGPGRGPARGPGRSGPGKPGPGKPGPGKPGPGRPGPGKQGPGMKASNTPNKPRYAPGKKMPGKVGPSQKPAQVRGKQNRRPNNKKKPSYNSKRPNAKGPGRGPARSKRSGKKPARGGKRKR